MSVLSFHPSPFFLPSYSPPSSPKPIALTLRNPHDPSTISSPPRGSPSLLDDWPRLLQQSIVCKDVHLGLAIHGFLVKSGLQFDVFPGNNLVNMYSKFGRLGDAQLLFDEMPIRNTITWTSLINGYAQAEDFSSVMGASRRMHRLGEKFNGHTCSAVLQACRGPEDCIIGQQVHGLCFKTGQEKNTVVGTSLASVYLRYGRLDDAEAVLESVNDVDIRCMNLMISEYGKMGDEHKALGLFCDLREHGLEPDDFTFTNMISACNEGADLGRQLHGLAVKCGAAFELSVGNALITMYGKHELLEDAERMFREIEEPNVVSWTAILSGHVKNGHHKKAIGYVSKLLGSELVFDSSCFATVLDACAHSKVVMLVNQIHGMLLKLSYLSDVFVVTALVDAYAKCGNVKAAKQIFHDADSRNVALCNAIIVEHCQSEGQEEEEDPITLFNWMRLNERQPDWITCIRLLSSSADEASLIRGMSLHAFVIKSGFEKDIDVGNSIISMYAKCGSMGDSFMKFVEMVNHDSISWNAMVSAFGIHGMGKEALSLMNQMEFEGLKPDEVTLVSILQACSYSGLFQNGFCIYYDMERKYGVKPSLDHQVCMVDLLGRSGNISGAMKFIKQSEFSNSPLPWRTLVNLCNFHSDLNLGMIAAEHLLHLNPNDVASHILVSNKYADAGIFERATEARISMQERKMKKEAGCSWIEINNKVHKFTANRNSYKLDIEVLHLLNTLNSQIKQKDIMQV